MKEVPGHHDRVRDLEDDHLDGVPHPLLGQFGLGHVGGESVQEEPRGLGPLLHGARHQLHNLVLGNVKLTRLTVGRVKPLLDLHRLCARDAIMTP